MKILKQRRIRNRFALIALGASVLLSSVLVLEGQNRSAPLDQMIATLGGDAFLNVKDIHTTGRFFSFNIHGELNGSDLFSDYIKFPDMERTEFGTQRFKSITINRGKAGSKVEGKKDPVEQTPGEGEEFLKGFQTSFDYVLRFVINDRQTTIQNLAREVVDFKTADVVELRNASKDLIRFYIDRNTHLPLRMLVRRNGESKTRKEEYANWHKFQDVMTPLFISRYTDDVKTTEIRAENAVYNAGLSDNLFTQLNPSK
jgi:hypothetical protein